MSGPRSSDLHDHHPEFDHVRRGIDHLHHDDDG
jgi:hypothetical protein